MLYVMYVIHPHHIRMFPLVMSLKYLYFYGVDPVVYILHTQLLSFHMISYSTAPTTHPSYDRETA